jgi:hypothetical protein
VLPERGHARHAGRGRGVRALLAGTPRLRPRGGGRDARARAARPGAGAGGADPGGARRRRGRERGVPRDPARRVRRVLGARHPPRPGRRRRARRRDLGRQRPRHGHPARRCCRDPRPPVRTRRPGAPGPGLGHQVDDRPHLRRPAPSRPPSWSPR